MDLLPSVCCPTLIVHGELDPMVPIIHPQYLHQHIQGSRYSTQTALRYYHYHYYYHYM